MYIYIYVYIYIYIYTHVFTKIYINIYIYMQTANISYKQITFQLANPQIPSHPRLLLHDGGFQLCFDPGVSNTHQQFAQSGLR